MAGIATMSFAYFFKAKKTPNSYVSFTILGPPHQYILNYMTDSIPHGVAVYVKGTNTKYGTYNFNSYTLIESLRFTDNCAMF